MHSFEGFSLSVYIGAKKEDSGLRSSCVGWGRDRLIQHSTLRAWQCGQDSPVRRNGSASCSGSRKLRTSSECWRSNRFQTSPPTSQQFQTRAARHKKNQRQNSSKLSLPTGSTKQSMLEEQICSLQSSLEETRQMLNHSQIVCEKLKAQLKDEQRRREKHQQEMKEQIDSQRVELEELSTELAKAHAALQQQTKELHRQVQENNERAEKMSLQACTARQCETELLGALMEHAAMQLSVREEPSPVQKLRAEREVARFRLSEEQEAADELRRKLQSVTFELEQFAELQLSSFLHEHRRHKAFEADIEKILQHLGQRHPGIADLPTPYGAGGG